MSLDDLTANAIDLLEPQRQSTGHLTLTVPGMNSGLLELAIQNFPLPKRSINVVTVPHLNETRKFAGNTTYDDLTITFTDFIDNDIASEVEKWWSRVSNSANGKIGWARQYKAQGIMHQYGPNGQYERQWRVQGVFPTSFDPGEMNQGSDDVVQISLTLAVDKAFIGDRTPSSNYGTT